MAKGPPARSDFQSFFEAEYARLGRALYLLTGEQADADDCAQEAFVRVFERWSRVSAMDSPTGYLYRTALNVVRSRARRRTTETTRAPNPLPTDPTETVDAEDQIMRMLKALPLRQRSAVVLVDWYGMGSEEAAAAMKVRPSTLRVHLARGRGALRTSAEVGDDDAR